ncbi:hypothetical protein [Nocardia camponoti]|uniref:Cell division protein FtsL n=1 Tax=Nocardia camponoti TaxID=1616106 RepID=A0A917QSS4_9NOCA|nr:hypothetical protein [Nocardia camponoti]GGK66105.1 hypothetical protein GCM10011591_42770 [Nocardia camponoti]
MSTSKGAVALAEPQVRRAETTDKTKSGAAQRAYARRRTREQLLDGIPVPPVTSKMAGRIPFVAAIIGLLGCGLALTLLLTTRAAEDSYQLGDARAVNRKLADERAALQREVATADSAPELASRARELGMIPAKDPARLVIGPTGEITVIGTPSAAQGAPVPPLNGPLTPTPSAGLPQGERVVPVQPGGAAVSPASPNGGLSSSGATVPNAQATIPPTTGHAVTETPRPDVAASGR